MQLLRCKEEFGEHFPESHGYKSVFPKYMDFLQPFLLIKCVKKQKDPCASRTWIFLYRADIIRERNFKRLQHEISKQLSEVSSRFLLYSVLQTAR